MGDECLSGLHLRFEINKEGQTNCEQIFGCLVITARMESYLCPICPILQSNFFLAAAFIVFCTHCQKLQNYRIEEGVALEARGVLVGGWWLKIAFSKVPNALSYTGPPHSAWAHNLEETH